MASWTACFSGFPFPIWSGEFSARLHAGLEFCVEKGADAGRDDRSLAVFNAWPGLPALPSELDDLRQELKSAARDGFVDKSDNKHSRMDPQPDFPGLQPITLAKTPSDRRELEDFVAQVEANLGITRLKQSRQGGLLSI